ncbi:GNAT family N-acetyltransferase [Streptacidiphilus sp. ASG 303]|uniref:GNAT family N-acetyltransferase n=1 Tax=Streptacidiphilus sp. ASG 303 TaxID=2896847 RepID=UPI001E28A71C|nr:GNAT family N-acetyltransferase [Streptacidiphilus sp. ASG 303]MCD0485952.1 GNAT family N-acetyltransferase [Streptacidiphilus sp. ASG 303]
MEQQRTDGARRATAADAEELVRLREVMLAEVAGTVGDGWQEASVEILRARLSAADPALVAFVADRPDRPGALAACVVGTVEYRLGGPGNPGGRTGYVFNVATDPGQRRRGHSRRCMTALLGWYRAQGVRTVDLRASQQGEPLYRSLGFVRTPDPAMRLRLPAAPDA